MADILDGDAEDVEASLAVIAGADADILVLQDIDYDAEHAALRALVDRLRDVGVDYPFQFALRPNTGRPTGIDIDGDGYSDGPRDAQGYGRFNGQGGMAVLSRFPVSALADFSGFAWRELPVSRGEEVLSPEAFDVLRLHTVGAWHLRVDTPDGPLDLLTSHAGTPVFDGPEDRNGIRNAEELRFWAELLDGWVPDGAIALDAPFALLGTFNVDPAGGEGHQAAVQTLLAHPRLQDPEPRSAQGLATVDWDDPDPGDLRVDYILPARGISVVGAGVLWPGDAPIFGVSLDTAAAASDHRLIWLDLEF